MAIENTVYIYDNGWNEAVPYIFSKDRFFKTYPIEPMTSSKSQNCEAKSDSAYSGAFPAWRCFDKSSTTAAWASTSNSSSPWVQLKMPEPLYDIIIEITNRGDRDDKIRGPIAGDIYGSNDGLNFTKIGSFSGRDGSTKESSSTITCTNSTIAYSYIRIKMTDWDPSENHTYCAIGEINISGYDATTNGRWREATAYTL